MCYECLPESISNPRLPNKPEQIPPHWVLSPLKTREVRSAGQVLPRHADTSAHAGEEERGWRKQGDGLTIFLLIICFLLIPSNMASSGNRKMMTDCWILRQRNQNVHSEYKITASDVSLNKCEVKLSSCLTLKQQTVPPSYTCPCTLSQSWLCLLLDDLTASGF